MTNNQIYNKRDRKLPVDPIREQFAVNHTITASTVRLINEAGDNLGTKSLKDALDLAYSQDLDLVLISPNVHPPVAKICDYGKFIYDQKQQKKIQERKSRENAIVIKEIQLRPSIGVHDIEVKRNHANAWLKDNCKIKVVLKFKGREMAHKNLGFAVIDRFLSGIESCKIEKQPELTSNMIVTIIAPAGQKK